MSIALVTRGMVLLIMTALTGVVSSALALLMGLWSYGARSVLFSVVLGFGVLVTNRLSQERLRKGQYPELVVALVVAVLTGLVAATVLMWQAQAFPPDLRGNSDFPPPRWMSGGPLLVVSVAYAVLLHGVYAVRGLVKRPNLTVLFGSVAAALVCGVLRASLGERAGGLGAEEFITSVLFGAMPFCLFWMLAVRIADPGWSPQRWVRSMRSGAED